jgi:putative ATPase
MADPFALTLAMSAAQAFDYVGPPEGHLFLAQLAVYLAAAPKSNSIYTAEAVVKKTIPEGNEPGVPFHIRNAPTGMMKELGYGRRYKYPHDYANGFVHETYLPEEIEGQRFYTPKKIGKEKIAAERLKLFWPERYDKK